MKVTKRKIDVYTIRGKCSEGFNTWGEITLELGEHSAKIMANSEYGSFAYNWFHTGSNPTQFLKNLNIDYAMEKLTEYDYTEPDYEAMTQIIKETIIQERQYQNITAEAAREAWNEMIPIVDEYRNRDVIHTMLWNNKHYEKIFGDLDSLPSPVQIKPKLVSFWNHIWTPFINSLDD